MSIPTIIPNLDSLNESTSTPTMSTGSIIGISVGCLLVLILSIYTITIYINRKSNRNKTLTMLEIQSPTNHQLSKTLKISTSSKDLSTVSKDLPQTPKDLTVYFQKQVECSSTTTPRNSGYSSGIDLGELSIKDASKVDLRSVENSPTVESSHIVDFPSDQSPSHIVDLSTVEIDSSRIEIDLKEIYENSNQITPASGQQTAVDTDIVETVPHKTDQVDQLDQISESQLQRQDSMVVSRASVESLPRPTFKPKSSILYDQTQMSDYLSSCSSAPIDFTIDSKGAMKRLYKRILRKNGILVLNKTFDILTSDIRLLRLWNHLIDNPSFTSLEEYGYEFGILEQDVGSDVVAFVKMYYCLGGEFMRGRIPGLKCGDVVLVKPRE